MPAGPAVLSRLRRKALAACAIKGAKQPFEGIGSCQVFLDVQVLAEARVRLVAGLKRYFHDKRGQGLLSGRGILVLDHACDVAMDGSYSPLVMWSSLERWASSVDSAPGPQLNHLQCMCRWTT